MSDVQLKKWLWIVFVFILSLFFLFYGISRIKKHKKEKDEKQKIEIQNNKKTESVAKAKVVTLPAVYTEYYTLKKGEVIRVNVPSGYSHTCAGGGKKYYYQAQNASKPIICGGGGYIDVGEHVAYFDLFYYDEEITVVCEFKKL